MAKFKIPTDIEKDAVEYMKNVLQQLEDNGVLENVDSAALTMLARNYSMFIKASK
jgi:phage terminase small subunit